MNNEDIKKTLNEILDSIKSLELRMDKLERGEGLSLKPNPTVDKSRSISIKEFIIDRKPKNDVQRTIVVAYFVEKHGGLETFNKEDLEKGFRLAKEPLPSNINDKVNMCIKNGYVMEAEDKKDNKKAWEITNTGEKYVEEELGINNNK